MSAVELLNLITGYAKGYQPDAIESIWRNQHMHDCRTQPTQETVDAVLTDFINFVAMKHGVDYALYSKDLKAP